MSSTGNANNNPNDVLVNPHNPSFLTNKPWYLSGDATAAPSGPTLEHQSGLTSKSELSLSAAEQLLRDQRAKQKQRTASGKFHEGQWVEALKNNKLPYRICKILKVNKKQTEMDLEFEDGSIEKRVKLNPRAAKPRVRMTKSGSRSAPSTKETFDSKRDQYHGYDNDGHNERLTEKFQAREEIRRKIRSEQKSGEGKKAGEKEDDEDKAASDSDFDDSDVESGEESEDEFAQRDEDAKVMTTRLARQGGVGGAQMKVTARNLRIREDTAKYLRNLDPNSAYYDPKSRSMRDNPNPEIPAEASEFAGDNFARISGDAVQLADTQLFAWEASDKGVSEIHPQANPSQAELLKKQFKSKAVDVKIQQKQAVLDKYGGSEYLDGSTGLALATAGEDGDRKLPPKPDRSLRFGVSSKAEEYNQEGRSLGTVEQEYKALPSKYEEDVYTNGHSCVWGSYFHRGAFRWGYADDHSLINNSYFTGENGRIANDESNELKYGTGVAGSAALAQARVLKRTMDEGSGTKSTEAKRVKVD